MFSQNNFKGKLVKLLQFAKRDDGKVAWQKVVVAILIAITIIDIIFILVSGAIIQKRREKWTTMPEQNIEDCQGAEGTEKSRCYMAVAENKRDAALCSRIKDDNFRSKCYLRVAKKKGDPEVCNKLSALYIDETSCYVDVAVETGKEAICARLKNDYFRDSCYSRVAKKKGDPQICNKISEISKKKSCYVEVAERIQEPSICKRWLDEDERNSCYDRVAAWYETPNPSICGMISDGDKRNWCYQEVARLQKNSSSCNKISPAESSKSYGPSKASCYLDVAEAKQSFSLKIFSLCSKVFPAGEKSYCYKKARRVLYLAYGIGPLLTILVVFFISSLLINLMAKKMSRPYLKQFLVFIVAFLGPMIIHYPALQGVGRYLSKLIKPSLFSLDVGSFEGVRLIVHIYWLLGLIFYRKHFWAIIGLTMGSIIFATALTMLMFIGL